VGVNSSPARALPPPIRGCCGPPLSLSLSPSLHLLRRSGARTSLACTNARECGEERSSPRYRDIVTLVRKDRRLDVDVDVATDLPEQRQSRHAGCAGKTILSRSSSPPRQLPGRPGLIRCSRTGLGRISFPAAIEPVLRARAARLSLFLRPGRPGLDLKNVRARLPRRTVDGITAKRPRHHPPFGRLLPSCSPSRSYPAAFGSVIKTTGSKRRTASTRCRQ